MSLRDAGGSYENYGSITQPLLSSNERYDESGSTDTDLGSPGSEGIVSEGKLHERRQIGVISAVFIIFNRIIGTGIMWLIGALISAAGMQVYITWGTALPKNGGEKNYLEYLFPGKSKYMITSMYASSCVLLAWTAGNSLVFGEYILKSLNLEPTRWGLRFVALGCITFAMLLHGTALKWGLRLQNFLGVFKLLVLFIVIGTGFVALTGHIEVSPPRNFERPFEGTKLDASSLCLCLYDVLWSYVGFSNVNYALSEVRNPKRTIRIAGPLAIGVVTVLYMLANVAYLVGASKEEITGSGRLVAALLFRNVYGPKAERVLDVFVAMSALGNVLAVIFSQGRVNQELGREGILPFSKLWASNLPFNAPLAGLWLHWLICVVTMFALPPGDAYNFVINTVRLSFASISPVLTWKKQISYPLSIINAVISFGAIYLTRCAKQPSWPRIGHGAQAAAFAFGCANVFLFIAPFIRPPPNGYPYEALPYWTHAAGGWAIFGLGLAYYLLWAVLIPWWGGYSLVRIEEKRDDGSSTFGFQRIPL
ncbi:hypothetical protein H0H92_005877 [Tricholoma furcatifolium]|nr:hypothetical protein H0H92_005877 [Tricholoma furcatifolium]